MYPYRIYYLNENGNEKSICVYKDTLFEAVTYFVEHWNKREPFKIEKEN